MMRTLLILALLIWDMEIDDNNDIVLVGDAQNMFGDGARSGFLMKIYADGNYTVSYPELPDDEPVVAVFPNPVTDFLRIKMLRGVPKACQLELYNAQGQLMLRQAIRQADDQVDLRSLPSGTYFYRIRTGEATLGGGKVVKE